MDDVCTFHPEHQAVESCEVCQRPLCGLCLWYTGDGYRLCQVHAAERAAKGEEVLSPETYQEAVRPQAASAPRRDQPGIYQGNSYDVGALMAAVAGLATIASCSGGIYCLPVITLLLGIGVFLKADQAVDRRRTRLLAGIGIGLTGLILLAIFAMFTFYIVLILVMMATGGP